MLINESEHVCASCGEDIHSVEELSLLQVVYVNFVDGALEFYAIESDQGEYQYKPQLFHIACWEDTRENLVEVLEDYEENVDEDAPSICECNGCDARIRPWATLGVIHAGELHRSQLMPNGESALCFVDWNNTPNILCLSCLQVTNHEVLELWSEIGEVA